MARKPRSFCTVLSRPTAHGTHATPFGFGVVVLRRGTLLLAAGAPQHRKYGTPTAWISEGRGWLARKPWRTGRARVRPWSLSLATTGCSEVPFPFCVVVSWHTTRTSHQASNRVYSCEFDVGVCNDLKLGSELEFDEPVELGLATNSYSGNHSPETVNSNSNELGTHIKGSTAHQHTRERAVEQHAASWPRRQPRQARGVQRQVLRGRSPGSPRDEAFPWRAPRDENESATTVRSRRRQHGAVSVQRSLGQRRGVERAASWPRRQPRQARGA